MLPSYTFYSTTTCPTKYTFFFFNDTATTEIYTLSLHDALPILSTLSRISCTSTTSTGSSWCTSRSRRLRSEEHTSELQSHLNLVCRLLLEKKKKINHIQILTLTTTSDKLININHTPTITTLTYT